MRIIQVYKGMFSAESDTYILENGSYCDYSEIIEFMYYPHSEWYDVKSVDWYDLDKDERALVRMKLMTLKSGRKFLRKCGVSIDERPL